MRGFSLIELLLTGLLVFLALGMIAMTASEYARISRYSSGQDDQFEVAARALSQITCELREAVRGVSPTSPAAASVISFEKVDLRANRFVPGSFHPQQPRLTVTYRLNGDQLTRQVSDGVSTTTDTVAEGIAGLDARLVGPRRLRIQIDVQNQTVGRDLYLWADQW